MRSSFLALWNRRHLLRILVGSHLKRTNRSSTLGFLWWFLDPLLMAAVYYVIVVVLLQRGGSNQPYLLFLVCGLFPWKAFSDTVSLTVTVLTSQAAIIKSVSFPMAVLPLAVVISNIIYFAFGLIVAAAIGTFYGSSHGTWPSAAYLFLPVVIAIQLVFTAGIALIASAVGLLFTDLQNITRHLLRVGYYMSPGLYGIERVPDRFLPLYMLNPFAGIMTAYREILMHGRLPAAELLMTPALLAAVTFAIGYMSFRRSEGRFVQLL